MNKSGSKRGRNMLFIGWLTFIILFYLLMIAFGLAVGRVVSLILEAG